MPACAIIGCTQRYVNGERVRLFGLPTVIVNQCQKTKELSTKRRHLWLSRINRIWGPRKLTYKSVKVCQRHFITGEPSKLFDSTHPDWAPSLHLGYENKRKNVNETAQLDRYLRTVGRRHKKIATIPPSITHDHMYSRKKPLLERSPSSSSKLNRHKVLAEEDPYHIQHYMVVEVTQLDNPEEDPTSLGVIDEDPPRMDEGHSNLLTTESTSEPDTGIGVPHPNNGTDSEFEHKDRDEESPQMVIDDEILERKRKRAEYNRKYAAKKKLLNVKNSEVEDKQKHAEDRKMKRVQYNRNYYAKKKLLVAENSEVDQEKNENVIEDIENHRRQLAAIRAKKYRDKKAASAQNRERQMNPEVVAVHEHENVSDKKKQNSRCTATVDCDFCDFKGPTPSHLKAHLLTHSGEKPYACDDCDYRATSSHNLKRHRLTHLGLKPYTCDLCGHSARSSSNLKVHMRIHSDDHPFVCEICNYRTRDTTKLKRHKLQKHDGSLQGDKNRFSCTLCAYNTEELKDLKKHIKTHREKLFTCHVCDYRAGTASTLKVHLRIHTGEKPYPCPHCPYRAKTGPHLTVHMRTHTGEKPFVCHICAFKTTQSCHLKKHITLNHGVSGDLNPETPEVADFNYIKVEPGLDDSNVSLGAEVTMDDVDIKMEPVDGVTDATEVTIKREESESFSVSGDSVYDFEFVNIKQEVVDCPSSDIEGVQVKEEVDDFDYASHTENQSSFL